MVNVEISLKKNNKLAEHSQGPPLPAIKEMREKKEYSKFQRSFLWEGYSGDTRSKLDHLNDNNNKKENGAYILLSIFVIIISILKITIFIPIHRHVIIHGCILFARPALTYRNLHVTQKMYR